MIASTKEHVYTIPSGDNHETLNEEYYNKDSNT